MSPEIAERLRDLFTAALEHPPDSRLAFVRSACGEDTTLYEDVAQLLSLHEQMERLDLAAEGEEDSFVGTVVGAYEIVRLLGAGGMGRVYLARRVDGSFQREVAIKIVDVDRDADADLLRRFEQERRIHASLRHPCIASLLDAGRTATGRLYFVMEYVDGRPITEYCEEQALGLRARIELFLRVCEAVSHAHRNFIVHRDLKPANILVDADGQPKLLDFGIAKPLTRASVDPHPTNPILTRATPAYSSPEHLAGGPTHTTMDLFALGIVLCEMTTGSRPAAPEGGGAGRARGVACPKSATLPRDLRAIIEKALHENPRERFRSADALADDLRAWMSCRPVAARSGGSLYRLSRFTRRNAPLTAAAVVAVLALLAATGVFARLWVVTRAERDRAGRQFAAVATLAESMFAVDEKLAVLDGTTGVRRLLVEAIGSYLEAVELTDDRQLLLDTANAYRRLGGVEGNPNGPNLGNAARALAHYDTALDILDRLRLLVPEDDAVRASRAETLAARADVHASQAAFDRALADYGQALELATALAARYPSDPRYQDLLGGIHRPLGDVRLAQGDVAGALGEFERALAIESAAATRFPGRMESKRLSGLTHIRLGDARAASGALAEARTHYEEATRILRSLGEVSPDERNLLRDAALGLARLGLLADAAGERGGRAEIARAVDILRTLAASDPSDARVRRDLMVALVQHGDALADVEPAASRAAFVEARQLARSVSAESPDDAQRTRDLAVVEARLAGRDARVVLDLFGGEGRRPLEAGDAPLRVGDTVRAVAQVPAGWTGYVLIFGAQGPAELLDAATLRRANWVVPVQGPMPAQTVLLIAVPGALRQDERQRLVQSIGAVAGPRTVDFDSHIVWTDHSERLESVATARGARDTRWALEVRSRIAALGTVQLTGRTFPIAPALSR